MANTLSSSSGLRVRATTLAIDQKLAQAQQARAAIGGGGGHVKMKAGQSVTELCPRLGGEHR
jgi:hypothetical protein